MLPCGRPSRSPTDVLAAARTLARERGISLGSDVPRDRIHGYRQGTDAHLIALARSHAGTLVTFA